MKLKFVSELIKIAPLRFFKALGGIEDYGDSSSELLTGAMVQWLERPHCSR